MSFCYSVHSLMIQPLHYTAVLAHKQQRYPSEDDVSLARSLNWARPILGHVHAQAFSVAAYTSER